MAKKAKSKKAAPRPKGRGAAASKRAAPESAYEKRIRRYLESHPGATRQEARGKKPKEHVEREKRERAKYGMSSHQRQSVRRFALKQAAKDRNNEDHDATAEQMLRWAREVGFDKFEALKTKVKELSQRKRRRVRQRVKRGGKVIRIDVSGRSANVDEMEDFAEDLSVPFEWLFYH